MITMQEGAQEILKLGTKLMLTSKELKQKKEEG
jgi:hypothetical protein